MSEIIQSLAIKQKVAEFVPEGDKLIELIENSCEGVGEISINLQDIYIRKTFDI